MPLYGEMTIAYYNNRQQLVQLLIYYSKHKICGGVRWTTYSCEKEYMTISYRYLSPIVTQGNG